MSLFRTPLSWTDIDHVVLIGGSALLPRLVERTAQLTGRTPKEIHLSSDSEHVVADGAAYYAYAGERTAQVLPGGLGVRMRQKSEYVYKMFFVPGHVISGTGETVEQLGQFVDSVGGPCQLELQLAEAKPAAQVRKSADGSAAYLPAEEAVPIHTIHAPCDLPAGQHEVRLRFDYFQRRLTYGISLTNRPNLEVVTGPVLDGNQSNSGASPSPRSYAVLIALDCSGSMEGSKLVEAKKAVGVLLDALGQRDVQVGLVAFGMTTNIACALTDQRDRVNTAANGLTADGGTPMDEAIRLAVGALAPASDRERILVVVTDGQPNASRVTAREAQRAREAGIRVIAVGIGADVCEAYLQHEIASRPEDYFYADEARDISRIFSNIVELYIL